MYKNSWKVLKGVKWLVIKELIKVKWFLNSLMRDSLLYLVTSKQRHFIGPVNENVAKINFPLVEMLLLVNEM